jgi:hypothetical protein
MAWPAAQRSRTSVDDSAIGGSGTAHRGQRACGLGAQFQTRSEAHQTVRQSFGVRKMPEQSPIGTEPGIEAGHRRRGQPRPERAQHQAGRKRTDQEASEQGPTKTTGQRRSARGGRTAAAGQGNIRRHSPSETGWRHRSAGLGTGLGIGAAGQSAGTVFSAGGSGRHATRQGMSKC